MANEVLPMVLTVRQVADALQVGINRAYELCRSGELPSFKIGNSVRVAKTDLEAFISQKVEEACSSDTFQF